jgi:hypothetical protein
MSISPGCRRPTAGTEQHGAGGADAGAIGCIGRDPRAISVDEFRRELVGVPLCGRPDIGPLAGKTVCTIYHSDGTAVVTGAGVDSRGRWEVDGQQICRRGADQKRLCLDYVRLGPNRFRNSTGTEFCIGPCP